MSFLIEPHTCNKRYVFLFHQKFEDVKLNVVRKGEIRIQKFIKAKQNNHIVSIPKVWEFITFNSFIL